MAASHSALRPVLSFDGGGTGDGPPGDVIVPPTPLFCS